MKKIIVSLLLVVVTLTSCSHNQANKPTVSPTENYQNEKSNIVYKIFPTHNMWTFIKLNTRNGTLWQVQYDVQGDNRFEIVLSSTPLVVAEKETNERFTLYSTQNIYTFILLDQVDGRMWQVQWSMEEKSRFIVPIN